MRAIVFLIASGALAQQLIPVPPGRTAVTDSVTGLSVPVTISAFHIGKAEVTQQDFESVMGYNRSLHRGPQLPVENVTWWEALRYLNRRSAAEKLTPCYDLTTGDYDRNCNGYRLPTEAEWTQALGPGKPEGNVRTGGTKDTAILANRSTTAVGSFPANELGLHDMVGNVWEWCQDRHSAVPLVDRTLDPAGPHSGPDRVIRGGSYLSTASQWNKGLRSSRDPNAASGFTGFRIARSAQPATAIPSLPVLSFGENTQINDLAPLLSPGVDWKTRRAAIRSTWLDVLGTPKLPIPQPSARLIETVDDPIYSGQLLDLQVEPDAAERIFIMRPHGSSTTARPVVIVPFYDIDTPAGRNLGGRRFVPPSVRSFAYLAVQRGYVAIAIRWFGESYGEGYDEAVANLAQRHPGVSGLGKWIWDAGRLLDYIETLPGVDAKCIGIIGHSLGGKMALYAAAMDERIGVIVSSEPGIGLKLSNYDDFWYLGERIKKLPATSDQHELLALIAPRPFLLIAGEDSDGDKSIPVLLSASPVYELLNAKDNLGFLNHRKGHSPTPESVATAMDWLAAVLR